MPEFPKQVEHSRLYDALRNFYKAADENIVETFEKFSRRRKSNVKGAETEDLTELEFNEKQFKRVVKELQDKEPKVEITWYEPNIVGGATPRLQTEVKSFQIEFRYGSWFKQSNDLW